MPRWKETSSKKVAEVITEKLKNPDLSYKDIERKTGVSKSVTWSIIRNELAQVSSKSDRITALIDDNNEILQLTWELVINKLKNWQKIDFVDLTRARDLALKQNALVGALSNPEANKQINVTFNL